MVILTLNCGSSSAKYQVYDWDEKEVLASGVVERVGISGSFITHKAKGEKHQIKGECPTHKEAIELIIKTLTDTSIGVIHDMGMIKAVGHRMLHGSDIFTKSVLVTPKVLETFKTLKDLGPLHMPANIMGIEAAQKVLPNVPHAVVLDTAWHQTMPDFSYMYAVPYEWYEKYSVRKYGFHGTSFLYTAKRAAVLLGKKPEETDLIICHIGNGASVCAVKDGKCFDTSMGLTPLDGLIMGTRSGEIDPAVVFYMMRKTGMSVDEMDTTLNKKSGVYAISGGIVDCRDLEEAYLKGNERATLAYNMQAYRLKKFIGAYAAALGRVDAVVFTAGIGENSKLFRELSLEGLEKLGITFSKEKNNMVNTNNAETCISSPESAVKIFVIPTDEELVITEDAYSLMKGTYDVHTNFTYSFQHADYVNKAREEALKKDIEKHPEIKNVLAKKR